MPVTNGLISRAQQHGSEGSLESRGGETELFKEKRVKGGVEIQTEVSSQTFTPAE